MSSVGSVGSGTRTEGGTRHGNTTQNDTARTGSPYQPSQSQTYDIRHTTYDGSLKSKGRNNPSIDTNVCYERTTRGAL